MPWKPETILLAFDVSKGISVNKATALAPADEKKTWVKGLQYADVCLHEQDYIIAHESGMYMDLML